MPLLPVVPGRVRVGGARRRLHQGQGRRRHLLSRGGGGQGGGQRELRGGRGEDEEEDKEEEQEVRIQKNDKLLFLNYSIAFLTA